MIEIKHAFFDEPIIIDNNSLLNVVIENQKVFRKFLTQLVDDLDNGGEYFAFYKDGKEVPISKNLFLIMNPLFLELDEKKINTVIQKDLVKTISEEQETQYKEIMANLCKWLNDVRLNSSVEIQFDDEMPMNTIFKNFNLSLIDRNGNDIEYFVERIKAVSQVFNIRYFVFVDLHCYFNKEEIDIIFNELLKHDIYFIIVSSQKSTDFLPCERHIIIDNDLAEIHQNFE